MTFKLPCSGSIDHPEGMAAQLPRLRIRRGPLLFASLATCFCFAAPAQEGAAPAKAADTAADNVERLEEVIVSAERLGRSLMDTATSVVVINAVDLERRPLIEGANELLDGIPNITGTGGTNFAPAVRGVDGTGPGSGADAFLAGARARLNLQIDGRPANFNEIIYRDSGVWDVQQVEVLRGAQSALQGRNAIAGTLSMKTNDPTYDTEAKVRVLAGNYDTRQYSAAFSAPIVTDQLAFRLSADHRESESFADFTGYAGFGRDPGAGHPGEFELNTYRAKLLIEPKAIEGFSALVTLNYSKSRSPQSEDVVDPVDADYTPGNAETAVMIPESTSGIVDLRWEHSEHLTFEALLALTAVDFERRAGEFAVPGVSAGFALTDGNELVIEPRVRFDYGRLSGLAGLYYFDAEQTDFLDFFLQGNWQDDVRTIAVFGEATYAFSASFDVTFGARFEEEHHRRAGEFPVFGPVTDLDETDQEFLPKLVLSWHLTEDLTLGALATRGYNGGGAAVNADAQPFTGYSFGPEFVWNYEAFARASLADGRLSLLGNLFYSDYDDMQLPSQILGGVPSITINAGQVVTYGAELAALWQALADLRLSGGIGLLETDIKEFTDPITGLPTVIEGNELPAAPALTANLGAAYQSGGFELSVDARYSSSYFSDIANEPIQETDSYVVANAQLAYSFGKVRVFAVVDNLFDEEARIYRYPPVFSGGQLIPSSATILRPRTYSIGAQVEF